MTDAILTQAELKLHLHYDYEKGIFTRLKSPSTRIKIGDIAGTQHKLGYRYITIAKSQYMEHRLAWLYVTGNWPLSEIDHINGIKNDNRFCNLREANRSENCFNKGMKKDNTSGYKGVSWDKDARNWKCQAGLNGKNIYIGRFKTAQEAAVAYQQFAIKNHDKFYNNNSEISSTVGL